MLLIADVKSLFPKWTNYCDGDDDILTLQMTRASNQILEYISDLTADNITDPLKEHYMNLVKKKCFDLKHDDSEFEHKPVILSDYEYTLTRLEQYRKSILTGPDDGSTTAEHITMDTKTRKFDSWFN